MSDPFVFITPRYSLRAMPLHVQNHKIACAHHVLGHFLQYLALPGPTCQLILAAGETRGPVDLAELLVPPTHRVTGEAVTELALESLLASILVLYAMSWQSSFRELSSSDLHDNTFITHPRFDMK
jgi:hypothetical protein